MSVTLAVLIRRHVIVNPNMQDHKTYLKLQTFSQGRPWERRLEPDPYSQDGDYDLGKR